MIRKTNWQRCPYCGTNITRTESEKFDGMCSSVCAENLADLRRIGQDEYEEYRRDW